MFELNLGLGLGFGLVLFTLILFGLVTRYLTKLFVPKPIARARALKIWKSAFGAVIIVAMAGFLVAFAWTGIYPTQDLDQPQGDLAPAEGVLKPMDLEEKREELRESGDKLQEKGQEKLDSFRKQFFEKEKEE